MNDLVKAVTDPIHTILGTGSEEELPEAVEAPIPDDAAALAAARRKTQRKYAGAGRAGTVLTSGDSKLG